MYTKSKRRGFTLVELLIVIVVIGVLAAMMMLSSTEAVSSAEATKIISNLVQMKKAATAWYLENFQRLKKSNNGFTIDGSNSKSNEIHTYLNAHPEEILKYMSNSFALNSGIKGESGKDNDYGEFYAALGGYSVYLGNKNTRLYVLYRLSNDNKKKDNAKLREKLKARAKMSGLLSYEVGKEPKQYNGENCVFMLVLRLDK